MLKKRLKSLK